MTKSVVVVSGPGRGADALGAELGPVVESLRRDGEHLLSAQALADLDAGADRLAQARCNVAVLGAFKRGKSTLVNALLEREVLPTGVLPLTSAVTVVRHGEAERLLVHFADARVQEHPLASLREFATELSNPGNGRGVRRVEVEFSHPLLADGLQLVDTPGIASVHRHNTAVAYDVLGRVDVALCVMSADQPLAEQELELYRAAAERAGQMLFVLAKVDKLSADERAQTIAFVAQVLREHGLLSAESGVLALSALDGQGIGELRASLRSLATSTRDRVVATALGRTAAVAAAELAHRCALEERALQLPLDQLNALGVVLEQRLAELEAARADANDLMERRVARLLQERVNEPLLGYARTHDDMLQEALGRRAAELVRERPRVLATAIDTWIDERIEVTFAALASELRSLVAGGLGEIASGHRAGIAALLADVHRAATDVLGMSDACEVPEVQLAEQTGFTFKLHDPEHGLDVMVASARRALPGGFGRRLVLRDASERLRAMTDRHAGRLRGELVARAQEAAADHRRRLDAAMDEACASVRCAISRAHDEHADGTDAAQARLEDLRARRERAMRAGRRLAAQPER